MAVKTTPGLCSFKSAARNSYALKTITGGKCINGLFPGET